MLIVNIGENRANFERILKMKKLLNMLIAFAAGFGFSIYAMEQPPVPAVNEVRVHNRLGQELFVRFDNTLMRKGSSTREKLDATPQKSVRINAEDWKTYGVILDRGGQFDINNFTGGYPVLAAWVGGSWATVPADRLLLSGSPELQRYLSVPGAKIITVKPTMEKTIAGATVEAVAGAAQSVKKYTKSIAPAWSKTLSRWLPDSPVALEREKMDFDVVSHAGQTLQILDVAALPPTTIKADYSKRLEQAKREQEKFETEYKNVKKLYLEEGPRFGAWAAVIALVFDDTQELTEAKVYEVLGSRILLNPALANLPENASATKVWTVLFKLLRTANGRTTTLSSENMYEPAVKARKKLELLEKMINNEKPTP